jgi:hypothetical protein
MVTFMDGTTVLAKDIALDANGQASFTSSNLAIAAHPIQVVYSGDANVMGSSSGAFTQSVEKGTTSALLKVTPNPTVFGESVTLKANLSAVAPAAGMPTGTVSFVDGSKVIGSVTLNGGLATFTTTSLSAGSHSLMVSYAGDISFTGMTSSAVAEVVNPASLTLSALQNTVTIAQGKTGSAGLQLTSQGSLSGPVSFACSGLPALSQCAFSPASVAASAVPAKLSVTITTTGAQMAGMQPAERRDPGSLPWPSLGVVLPAAVLLGIGSRQGRLRAASRAMLLAGAAALLLSLAGCGGSGTPQSNGGTQPGTYKVIVTASSGTLVSSTPLTVTIMP